MRAFVVTPPAPVVTWEEADAHLKLDGDESQKAEVEAFIAAATASIDGPDGWLGRAIGSQVIELRGSFFAGCELVLPFPPIISVTSIKYLDGDGVEQTLAPDRYEQRGRSIVTAFGTSWPRSRCDDEAVRVRYQAGYEALPAPIRAAILLMVGDLYRYRDTVAASSVQSVPMSTTVENLLAPFRVFG